MIVKTTKINDYDNYNNNGIGSSDDNDNDSDICNDSDNV